MSWFTSCIAGSLLAASACGGRSNLGVWTLDESTSAGMAGAGGTLGAAGRLNAGGAGQTGAGGMNQGGAGQTGAGRAGAGTAGDTTVRLLVATAISAGTDGTCAVITDGSVWCWGANEQGQLGDGTMKDSYVPVRVLGISDAVAVTTGGTWHSGVQGASRNTYGCAVLRDGTVHCWGVLGAVVNTAGINTSSVPVPVPGVTGAVAIAGGDEHVCALLEGGTVECWGDNAQGELGNGPTPSCAGCASEPEPVTVSTLSGVTDLAGKGSLSTCGVLADGSVHCWGALSIGPMAQSPTVSAWPFPILGVVASRGGLDVGYFHACAVLRDDGSVQCWGKNSSGELGALTVGSDAGPVTVPNVRGAIAVAAGLSFSCALLGNGSVQCWGQNSFGQLADGTLSNSDTRVPVTGLTDAVAVSAGYNHACAITSKGSVRCWGSIGGNYQSIPTTIAGF
ncbi:MAG TPA: hypothetical protein VNN72_21680 [Polyangiaceae bacterium]|nr:hypothetical protein [Polyangiaceae bacterium]